MDEMWEPTDGIVRHADDCSRQFIARLLLADLGSGGIAGTEAAGVAELDQLYWAGHRDDGDSDRWWRVVARARDYGSLRRWFDVDCDRRDRLASLLQH